MPLWLTTVCFPSLPLHQNNLGWDHQWAHSAKSSRHIQVLILCYLSAAFEVHTMKSYLASISLHLGLLFLSLLWGISSSPWFSHQGYLPSSLCFLFGLTIPVLVVPKQKNSRIPLCPRLLNSTACSVVCRLTKYGLVIFPPNVIPPPESSVSINGPTNHLNT